MTVELENTEIIDYSEKYKDDFKRLNLEWIQKSFVVEPSDEYVLSNPTEAIINKEGFIYFAKCDDKIAGTFALIKVDEKTYEIAKMAVNEKFQNRGIGRMLMNAAIQKANDMRLHKLVLYSNTNLATAVNMYFKYRFSVIPKNDFHNNRANIKMEKIMGTNELFKDYTLKPANTVEKFVELFNKRDADGLSELYHDDAINHQVANEPVVGKIKIKEMFKNEFAQAEMNCIVEHIFEDGEWAILEWRDPLGLRGCGFFHIINGKIKFQRGYWDKLTFLKQHHLPIPEE